MSKKRELYRITYQGKILRETKNPLRTLKSKSLKDVLSKLGIKNPVLFVSNNKGDSYNYGM